MVDFVKAANNGIRAHQEAERERILIARTIQELREQLQGQFGSEFSISVKESTRTVHASSTVGSALSALSIFSAGPRMTYRSAQQGGNSELDVPYTALVAEWKDRSWDLCQWVQEGSGFPVKLRYAGKDITCRDQRTFESGLVDLLGSAPVGEVLAAVQKLTQSSDLSAASSDPQPL